VLTFFRLSVDVVPTTTSLAYYQSGNLVVHNLRERARLLAIGVRARRVAYGTFYQSRDSLIFDYYVTDIVNERASRRVRRVIFAADSVMLGIDSVSKRVALAILEVASLQQAASLEPPDLQHYTAFVRGLDAYVQRDFNDAAGHFADATNGAATRRFQVWLADALARDRQYAHADSVLGVVKPLPLQISDRYRADMTAGRIHGDLRTVYLGADALRALVPADDLAAFDFALAALARNRPRQARTALLDQDPTRGALRSRPDYYLHLAAAHHLAGEHDRERRVARRGSHEHATSVEVKLALCRAEAARRDGEDATNAVHRLASVDAQPGATITIAAALRDCAAELRFHGLPHVAETAEKSAAVWERRRPTPVPAPWDSAYERGHLAYDEARRAAQRGDVARALEQLWSAFESGLPHYEPGRVMLHADPAFVGLRRTRGWRMLVQQRG
jgi:hypothetical protein